MQAQLTLLRHKLINALHKLQSIRSQNLLHLPIMYILEGIESAMVLPPEQRREEEKLLIDDAASAFSTIATIPFRRVAHDSVSLLVRMRHELDTFKRHAET